MPSNGLILAYVYNSVNKSKLKERKHSKLLCKYTESGNTPTGTGSVAEQAS